MINPAGISTAAINTAATGEATNPIGLPWGEVVIAAIAFGVLVWVLAKFVWPQFESAYAARTKAIEGGIAKAEEAQNEARAALDRYTQQLAGAREEAAKIREDARAQAQAIRDDMLAKAHQETERIAAAGRAQLEAQRSQIVAELRGDLGRMSVDLAGRIVGESMESEVQQNRTVERFLAELDA